MIGLTNIAGKVDELISKYLPTEAAPYVSIALAVVVILSAALFIGSILQYFSIEFYSLLCYRPRSMRKLYSQGAGKGKAWALVSGGSSGIGLAVVKQLAADGLNIVVVALGDDVLDKAVAALRKEFPEVEFRSVGANLAKSPDTYMDDVIESTKDILPRVLFLNAGEQIHYICLLKHMAQRLQSGAYFAVDILCM